MIGAGLLLGNVGCNYDLLPSTELPALESIQNEDDLQMAVYGAYEMITVDRGGYASDYTLYADAVGGDTYWGGNNGHITPFMTFSVDYTHSLTDYIYFAMYEPIAFANMAIAAGEALEQTPGVVRLVGELKAMRAIMHLDIARVYAQVPTLTGINMDAANSGIVIVDRVFPSNQQFTRSTLTETYSFIVNELKNAMTALNTAEGKDKKIGGLNYWSAEAALARAYLYLGDWGNAYTAATNVINGRAYTLYTHDNYLDQWKSDGPSEVIAEFTTSDNSKNNPQRNSLGGYTNPEGYAEVAASTYFKAYITSVNDNDIRKQSVTERTSATGNPNTAWYTIKYTGKTGSGSPTYNNNARIYRLAEMYLIAAEAAVKAGQGANADKYYNDLRRSRYAEGTYTDVTGVTVNDILEDRRIELFCEGHRMLDLKRNNLPVPDANDATKTRPANDNLLLIPYPIKELDVSPGLVQNPGYGDGR